MDSIKVGLLKVKENEKLLVFTISGQNCALPLSRVERIVRLVEINPLPKAPEIVTGLINFRGLAVPVLNIRKLFRLPDIETTLNDQLIIADTSSRTVAILIENSLGVAEYREQDLITADELFPGIEHLEGVVKLKDGIAYIYDIDRFLSLEEKTALDRMVPPGVRMTEMGSE